MPKIGEVKRARDIGKSGCNGSIQYIWHACIACGKERWVHLVKGKPRHSLCQAHFTRQGKSNPHWKGGRVKNKGYISVKLQPDDFFYPMTREDGYVMEHRLAVAKALGRCLLPWEVVHHKGAKYPMGSIENRSDNRYPENLQLLEDKKYHLIDSLLKSHLKKQAKVIKELETKIALLEAELGRR